jgi:hypothetical protein
MRVFRPTFVLSHLAAQQTTMMDKLGGAPWGLPAERWPRCGMCDGWLSLVAQFAHHHERLDLGRAGRALFIFWCDNSPGTCDAFSVEAGGNACVIVEPEDLSTGPTVTLTPARSVDRRSEVLITAWSVDDDGIPDERLGEFLDDARASALPEAILARADDDTRIGGAPCPFVSATDLPAPPFRFALQIGEGHTFKGPLPEAVRATCRTQRCSGDERAPWERPANAVVRAPTVEYDSAGKWWSATFGEFCTHGPAYVFVPRDVDPPRFVAFAQ